MLFTDYLVKQVTSEKVVAVLKNAYINITQDKQNIFDLSRSWYGSNKLKRKWIYFQSNYKFTPFSFSPKVDNALHTTVHDKFLHVFADNAVSTEQTVMENSRIRHWFGVPAENSIPRKNKPAADKILEVSVIICEWHVGSQSTSTHVEVAAYLCAIKNANLSFPIHLGKGRQQTEGICFAPYLVMLASEKSCLLLSIINTCKYPRDQMPTLKLIIFYSSWYACHTDKRIWLRKSKR